jgi:putative PIN family toxin of toxin-antitoxin system
MAAVVDTKVGVSATLNQAGVPAASLAAIRARRFTLVVSEPLLAEVAEVLGRSRFAEKYGVTAADIGELLALLRERAELVPATGAIRLCRDPDDDLVIETALNGRADVLVTRDDDLKSDANLFQILLSQGIEVLSVRRFLARLDDSYDSVTLP